MIESKRIDIFKSDRFVTFEKLTQDGIAKWAKLC